MRIRDVVILCSVYAISLMCAIGCEDPSQTSVRNDGRRLSQVKKPTTQGVAVALVVDTSGSMSGHKMEAAKAAAVKVIEQCNQFKKTGTPLKFGVYSFASGVYARYPVSELDPAAAVSAVERMEADGGTAIGEAVIAAKDALDQTGFESRHVVLVTDGDNTEGRSPAGVAYGITQQSPEDRCSVYLVAFDVNAMVFGPLKAYGWKVSQADNPVQLEAELGRVMKDDVLLEK